MASILLYLGDGLDQIGKACAVHRCSLPLPSFRAIEIHTATVITYK